MAVDILCEFLEHVRYTEKSFGDGSAFSLPRGCFVHFLALITAGLLNIISFITEGLEAKTYALFCWFVYKSTFFK